MANLTSGAEGANLRANGPIADGATIYGGLQPSQELCQLSLIRDPLNLSSSEASGAVIPTSQMEKLRLRYIRQCVRTTQLICETTDM